MNYQWTKGISGYVHSNKKYRHLSMNGPAQYAETYTISRAGKLMNYLVILPRSDWTKTSPHGNTLLHFACEGPNKEALLTLLLSGLIDINATNMQNHTAAFVAAECDQPQALELLCAAGIDLTMRDIHGHTCIDWAVSNDDCMRVLIANGVRLNTVNENYHRWIYYDMNAFERGVLRCRSAVVAMLRVKKAGMLWRWDKFLLRELAIAVWTTRMDTNWKLKL